MSAKSARERHTEELDAHYQARREQGLPAHRVQEHAANVDGIEIATVAGVVYLNSHGEKALSQDGVFTLIKELQAAFQAVS